MLKRAGRGTVRGSERPRHNSSLAFCAAAEHWQVPRHDTQPRAFFSWTPHPCTQTPAFPCSSHSQLLHRDKHPLVWKGAGPSPQPAHSKRWLQSAGSGLAAVAPQPRSASRGGLPSRGVAWAAWRERCASPPRCSAQTGTRAIPPARQLALSHRPAPTQPAFLAGTPSATAAVRAVHIPQTLHLLLQPPASSSLPFPSTTARAWAFSTSKGRNPSFLPCATPTPAPSALGPLSCHHYIQPRWEEEGTPADLSRCAAVPAHWE